MKANKNDEIYRIIASRYEEEIGRQLLSEKGMLEQQSPQPDTRRLDELVRRGTRRRRNMKTARWAAAIAACVLFAVLAPLWYPLVSDIRQPDTAESSPSAAEEMPEAEGTQELIPLGFTLPENFTVEGVELDNGMSVYYLSDSRKDPVVLQLQHTEADGLQTGGLTELEIGGRPVYGRSADAYHLLTFESNGLVYTLTCAYDINTLVPLCESIL